MTKKLVRGIGVWAEQDIDRMLRAIDVANANIASAVPTQEMDIYRMGYSAAINALSEAFGANYRSEVPAEKKNTRLTYDRRP